MEGIQEAIDDLPGTALKGGGHATAMSAILDQVEALVASGDAQATLKKPFITVKDRKDEG